MCILANARSLKNKLLDFQAAVYSNDFYIIAITETWLNASILDHEILPSGYLLHRRKIVRTGKVEEFCSQQEEILW